MSRVLAYDLARLFIGPLFLTPRGIDRVDLAVARYVFADEQSHNLGILPTPWGVRAYPAAVVHRLLAQLQHQWSEEVADQDDPKLLQLIAQISTPFANPDRVPPPAKLSVGTMAARILNQLRATGLKLGRPARRAVPPGSIYINIGQLGLAVPFFHNWLDERKDLTCAIMLHDVIPLEYPQLVGAAAVNHHARMVRTAARHADCLIFNSDYARESVNAALARHGQATLPSLVRSLPLPAAFAEASVSVPQLVDVNYFVAVSTIEPRKNHELLIRAWKRLIKRMGVAAPHLVIVGSLGYGAQHILADLDHEPVLRARIHLVAGLSSRALASLVLGATGMLCPSLAEGFGLPVLEANAMGVPTIASDIAAHREVGDSATILLPTDDEAAWERAIAALAPAGARVRPPVPHHLTEAAYCADLVDYLEHRVARAN